MTKTKKPSEMSLEELETSYKKLRPILFGLSGFMLSAAVFMIYVAIKTGNYALIAIVLGSGITLVPMFMQYSQIKKEIAARQKN